MKSHSVDHLRGAAPKDVTSEKKVLEFALTKQAALDLQHNDKAIRDRESRLKESGAFRVQEPFSKFERSCKPRYNDQVRQVDKTEGGVVFGTEGQQERVKFVKPVPRRSANIVPTPYARRGSVQTDTKKRRLLEPFAKKLIRHIGRGNSMELWRVGEFMKKQGNFNAAAREAGINMKSKIANFLRAFPELFTVQTSAQGWEANATATKQ